MYKSPEHRHASLRGTQAPAVRPPRSPAFAKMAAGGKGGLSPKNEDHGSLWLCSGRGSQPCHHALRIWSCLSCLRANAGGASVSPVLDPTLAEGSRSRLARPSQRPGGALCWVCPVAAPRGSGCSRVNVPNGRAPGAKRHYGDPDQALQRPVTGGPGSPAAAGAPPRSHPHPR